MITALSIIFPTLFVGAFLRWVTHNKTRCLSLKGVGTKVMIVGGAAAVLGSVGGIVWAIVLGVADFSAIPIFALIQLLFAALYEEAAKFFAVYWATKKLKNLQYSTDVLLYAVLAALGFAFAEALLFAVVAEMSIFSAIIRSVKSVPAHVVYSSLVAISYLNYIKTGDKSQFIKGYMLVSITHGLGNFCLLQVSALESDFSSFYFLIGLPFIIILVYVIWFRIVKNYKLSFENIRQEGYDVFS